jgi:hypothetical protein
MKQLRRIVTAGILTLSLVMVSYGGTITGSKNSASGARIGTITGSRTGTITGSRTGTITGSRLGTITGSTARTNRSLQDELLTRLITLLIAIEW